MTTITLPSDVDLPLTEAAHRLGTSPELLAIDSLRRLFAPAAPSDASNGGTLADYLARYVGTVEGTTEALSENCGQRFTSSL
jgi:hypothetical protein